MSQTDVLFHEAVIEGHLSAEEARKILLENPQTTFVVNKADGTVYSTNVDTDAMKANYGFPQAFDQDGYNTKLTDRIKNVTYQVNKAGGWANQGEGGTPTRSVSSGTSTPRSSGGSKKTAPVSTPSMVYARYHVDEGKVDIILKTRQPKTETQAERPELVMFYYRPDKKSERVEIPILALPFSYGTAKMLEDPLKAFRWMEELDDAGNLVHDGWTYGGLVSDKLDMVEAAEELAEKLAAAKKYKLLNTLGPILENEDPKKRLAALKKVNDFKRREGSRRQLFFDKNMADYLEDERKRKEAADAAKAAQDKLEAEKAAKAQSQPSETPPDPKEVAKTAGVGATPGLTQKPVSHNAPSIAPGARPGQPAPGARPGQPAAGQRPGAPKAAEQPAEQPEKTVPVTGEGNGAKKGERPAPKTEQVKGDQPKTEKTVAAKGTRPGSKK